MIGRCSRPSNFPHDTNSNQGSVASNVANVKQNQVRPMTLSEQDQDHPHSMIMRQTILPTTIIRSSDGGNQTTENGGSEIIYCNLTVPALPHPTRRKIRNSNESKEMDESVTFAQSSGDTTIEAIKERRRKNKKKTLIKPNPTLSPIHESGYSNPTSPIPCRHLNNAKANGMKTKIETNNSSSA